MSHRLTTSPAKRLEYLAIAELLKRGLDVYATLADDRQIDCVIRNEDVKGKPKYLDVRIRARSGTGKNAGFFTPVKLYNPRPNYIFIFYSEPVNTCWVIPSLALAKVANRSKSGKTKGTYSLMLASETEKGWRARPKYRKYENAFELLK